MYGVITIAIGIAAIILLVDFPDKASFLTPEERNIVTTRIERDRRDAVPDPLTFKKCLIYLAEIRTWLFGIFFCSAALGVYALAYFLPTILHSMGFVSIISLDPRIPI